MDASAASPLKRLTNLSKRQVEFLSEPSIASLFKHHPNDIAEAFFETFSSSRTVTQNDEIPHEWLSWWKWASDEPDRWLDLIKENTIIHTNEYPSGSETFPASSFQCPSDVVNILLRLKSVSIPRFADSVTLHTDEASFSKNLYRGSSPSLSVEEVFLNKKPMGMSPKKMHEVCRMASYIFRLIETLERESGISISHVVDVGAGQGYLSRALRDMRPTGSEKRNIHVLALDSVDEQTSGAKRRQARAEKQNKNSKVGKGGSVTHRTLQLGFDLRNDRELANAPSDQFASQLALEAVINEWLEELEQSDGNSHSTNNLGSSSKGATPILFVALHACGSLTPTILRQVVTFKSKTSNRAWYCAAAVVVGCCYNLLEHSDFPLSDAVKAQASSHSPPLDLSASYLQLAAQVPLQWLRSDEALSDFNLALRKMSYRALLSAFLQNLETSDDQDNAAKRRRVGKLNDNAYIDFDTFLVAAGAKLQVDFMEMRRSRFPDIENSPIVRQLEVLHVLRCILGPAVESLIVIDRLCWLEEAVGGELDVELVNLFDQATSSGRNLGIVVRPR